jgi:hypothetical protein
MTAAKLGSGWRMDAAHSIDLWRVLMPGDEPSEFLKVFRDGDFDRLNPRIG